MILGIIFVVVCIGCAVLCGLGINGIINIGENSRNNNMYYEE